MGYFKDLEQLVRRRTSSNAEKTPQTKRITQSPHRHRLQQAGSGVDTPATTKPRKRQSPGKDKASEKTKPRKRQSLGKDKASETAHHSIIRIIISGLTPLCGRRACRQPRHYCQLRKRHRSISPHRSIRIAHRWKSRSVSPRISSGTSQPPPTSLHWHITAPAYIAALAHHSPIHITTPGHVPSAQRCFGCRFNTASRAGLPPSRRGWPFRFAPPPKRLGLPASPVGVGRRVAVLLLLFIFISLFWFCSL